MADLSGILPHDGTSTTGTSAHAKGYRQAWLSALEDASMSRCDRWKMSAHEPLGDERDRGGPVSSVVSARMEVPQLVRPLTTTRTVQDAPDPAGASETETGVSFDAMCSIPSTALAGSEWIPCARGPAPIGELPSAGTVSSRPEVLLWQRQRLTILPSAGGGVEVWVRDAAMSGASRVASLLQDLRRTFGDTAASLVKVAVNGKMIYRQDAATRAGRSHSEVIRNGS